MKLLTLSYVFFYFLDVSVKDWRRKLLQMAADSIAANFNSNKDKNEEPSSKIDAEVKLLMQRQDWLVNMKQVKHNKSFSYSSGNCNEKKK